jgi:hypothetical protein
MFENGCRTCASASALSLDAQPAQEESEVRRIWRPVGVFSDIFTNLQVVSTTSKLYPRTPPDSQSKKMACRVPLSPRILVVVKQHKERSENKETLSIFVRCVSRIVKSLNPCLTFEGLPVRW